MTHGETPSPVEDDGAVRATTTVEHYIPGWEERDEWPIPEDED